MADCIDRKRAMFECERFFKEDKEAQEQCMSLLSMMPSADVVEVVRCRDCKYAKHPYNLRGMESLCECEYNNQTNKSDDFCSWGERKDKNND